MVNSQATTTVPVYVLDSFAVLAYLEGEPAAERVRNLLIQAQEGTIRLLLCLVNYGEVVYITERERGLPAAQRVIGLIDQLPITVVAADLTLTLAAAHVKALHSIAYADAYAVALAQAHRATLLTGDPELQAVVGLIAVEWLSR